MENPFTGVERILRSMKQTEVNDGLGVLTILVEQFRDGSLKAASTVRIFIELDVDETFIEFHCVIGRN